MIERLVPRSGRRAGAPADHTLWAAAGGRLVQKRRQGGRTAWRPEGALSVSPADRW